MPLQRHHHYWSHTSKEICGTDIFTTSCLVIHYFTAMLPWRQFRTLVSYFMTRTSRFIIWQSNTPFPFWFSGLNHMNSSISQSYSKLIRLKWMCSNYKRIDNATAQTNQTMFSLSRIKLQYQEYFSYYHNPSPFRKKCLTCPCLV